MSFEEMWGSLLPIGRDPRSGGYNRFSWTQAELDCRAWFRNEAQKRGLPVEEDPNGNLIAWWHPHQNEPPTTGNEPRSTTDEIRTTGDERRIAGDERRTTRGEGDTAAGDGRRGLGGRAPQEKAVVSGSHLDSVPGGGAFDGPLGVVSALAAFDLLKAEGVRPHRPLGIAVFAEEEGARFGVACLGSRLLTGAITPERARNLKDAMGTTFAEATAAHGLDPDRIGRDDDLLDRIGCFVELHVEQGRAMSQPVGIASAIWPHGRWRLDFEGRGDHAGTTRLQDRRDPMIPFAHTVLAARDAAARHETLATVGKVHVTPGGVNAIPSHVTAWLDARGPADDAVRATVADVSAAARIASDDQRVEFAVNEESYTEIVAFNTALRDRMIAPIKAAGLPEPPVLPTGAGHDAGILSAHLPTAMLFVRNPTGISHAPQEHAELADCLAGVTALAAVLRDLLTAPSVE